MEEVQEEIRGKVVEAAGEIRGLMRHKSMKDTKTKGRTERGIEEWVER